MIWYDLVGYDMIWSVIKAGGVCTEQMTLLHCPKWDNLSNVREAPVKDTFFLDHCPNISNLNNHVRKQKCQQRNSRK